MSIAYLCYGIALAIAGAYGAKWLLDRPIRHDRPSRIRRTCRAVHAHAPMLLTLAAIYGGWLTWGLLR